MPKYPLVTDPLVVMNGMTFDSAGPPVHRCHHHDMVCVRRVRLFARQGYAGVSIDIYKGIRIHAGGEHFRLCGANCCQHSAADVQSNCAGHVRDPLRVVRVELRLDHVERGRGGATIHA